MDWHYDWLCSPPLRYEETLLLRILDLKVVLKSRFKALRNLVIVYHESISLIRVPNTGCIYNWCWSTINEVFTGKLKNVCGCLQPPRTLKYLSFLSDAREHEPGDAARATTFNLLLPLGSLFSESLVFQRIKRINCVQAIPRSGILSER